MHEEIACLNIEIKHVITHMHDEDCFLTEEESIVKEKDPQLAYHINLYREERGHANALHEHCFCKLSGHPGFTGDLSLGVAVPKNTETDETTWQGSAHDRGMDEVIPHDSDDENVCVIVALVACASTCRVWHKYLVD